MESGSIFLYIIGAIFYLMPTWIAIQRKGRNAGAIFLVNLAFGWTVAAWIAALIWACVDKPGEGPEKVCPSCAEKIKAAATVCRFCGKGQA